MEISTKCDIIEEFIRDHVFGNEISDSVDEFIGFNDLGIPLAQAVSYDLATLTKNGEYLVEETWKSLCEMLGADPDGEYEEFDDLFYDPE